MAFAPARIDFDGIRHPAVIRGSRWWHEVEFVDDLNGGPYAQGITSQWKASVRDSPDGPLVTDLTVVVSGAGAEFVTLSLTKTQTAALTPGRYWYHADNLVDGDVWLSGVWVLEGDYAR